MKTTSNNSNSGVRYYGLFYRLPAEAGGLIRPQQRQTTTSYSEALAEQKKANRRRSKHDLPVFVMRVAPQNMKSLGVHEPNAETPFVFSEVIHDMKSRMANRVR